MIVGVRDVLTGNGFARRMAAIGPFEARPRLAVAVSGGADSLCLALLADRWARDRDGRIVALTVDHGLRPGSADEADGTGCMLRGLGIEHHVLPWTAAKPATGVQAAARDARHALLGDWCRANGVLHLLLAHNQDDQAETVLLRLGAGSGPDGLAAMTPVRETPDVRVLRPLLDVPAAAIRDHLRAIGQEWIEDPSNRDARFARVRARRAIAAGGLDAGALALAAERFARARRALEAETSRLLARAVRLHPAGFARLGFDALAGAEPEIALRALARTIAAVGGRAHPPAFGKMERLYRSLFSGAGDGVATLGGCRLAVEGNTVLVCREARNLPEPLSVSAGDKTVLRWDRRFEVRLSAPADGGTLVLAGLGGAGWNKIVGERPELRRCSVPATARTVLPALSDAAGVLEVPQLGYFRRGHPRPDAPLLKAHYRPPAALSGVGFALPIGPGVLSL